MFTVLYTMFSNAYNPAYCMPAEIRRCLEKFLNANRFLETGCLITTKILITPYSLFVIHNLKSLENLTLMLDSHLWD